MKINPRLTEIGDCLYRIAVKAIIVKDGKVLLVKEQDDEWWSFPGGGIDYGESTEHALGRELPEELGFLPMKSRQTTRSFMWPLALWLAVSLRLTCFIELMCQLIRLRRLIML